jgi:predicted Na+-dependent transporter
VAVLIWAMVYPMMVAVDFSALTHVGDKPKGLIITLAVNWLIKPFTMAALGVLFFEVVFAPFIDPADAQQYLAGLILLGAAPCTAMVFVWSQLTRGDPAYTLVQVSVNDAVMVVAFAPIVAFLLGVTDIPVPWETLLLSVALYVVIPLAAGAWTRARLMRRGGAAAVSAFTDRIKPVSVTALLATVMLLFGFQGETILDRPLVIAHDRGADPAAILRHLRAGLRRGVALARAVQCGGALRADRHVEFLRAGRRRRHQPVRPRLGRGAGHCRRRAGRGAGDAVARRPRQSSVLMLRSRVQDQIPPGRTLMQSKPCRKRESTLPDTRPNPSMTSEPKISIL